MRKLKNEELNRKSPDEFRTMEKLPIVVVLDNVRSAYNVGSVFRTADAFPIEELYLCGITGYPPHKEISKTALGSTKTIKWKYLKSTLEAISELKGLGYKIYAIEQVEGSLALDQLLAPDSSLRTSKLALVFGHEVDGVQQDVINVCDGCIEIPQGGTKHSLNIAVSAGVVLWEFFRKI
ncbi:MAG: TrmH family RNA methyltransferase [Bacteroidetes bacterium]|nr:MAG: TrmH family RNA methyltransferase [Bacteroidota bacterium]